jgi:hypothetical protein
MSPTHQAHHLFQLALPQASLWLELPDLDPSAQDGVAQARALAPALGLLAALEQWLGTRFLAIKPIDGVAPPWPHASQALTLPLLHGGGNSARLAVPWTALPWGQKPPVALAVQWPRWRADVLLQTLDAQRVSAQSLRPGAVLLLPTSFTPASTWPVQLQLGDGLPHRTVGRDACWHTQQSELTLHEGRTPELASTAGAWCLVHEQPLQVDARAWFGGLEETLPLPTAGVHLMREGQSHAHGRLMPCGPGFGFLVDTITTDLSAALPL